MFQFFYQLFTRPLPPYMVPTFFPLPYLHLNLNCSRAVTCMVFMRFSARSRERILRSIKGVLCPKSGAAFAIDRKTNPISSFRPPLVFLLQIPVLQHPTCHVFNIHTCVKKSRRPAGASLQPKKYIYQRLSAQICGSIFPPPQPLPSAPPPPQPSLSRARGRGHP